MCGILCTLNTLNTISIKDFISKLKLLQHRGQNSFGYCYIQNNIPTIVREKGLIKDYTIQTNTNHSIFLGHTRYVTSGKKTNTIEMPLLCNHNKFGEFVFVFNGNIDLKNYNYEVDSILIKEFLENCSENSFKILISKLKEFGANEIHIRIASPQIKYTCELGIDIPTKEELLMNKYNSIEKANHYLGSNSLKFIELDKRSNVQL